jgi:hypothetical protein
VVRRRAAPAPLQTVNYPFYCVVKNRTQHVLSWKSVSAGTDLNAIMQELIAAATASGWVVEDGRTDYGIFFCVRGTERILVTLQPSKPTPPLASWGIPPEAPSFRECFT